MTKEELVVAVESRCKPKDTPSHAAARRLVAAVFDEIAMRLERGESVSIAGFGTFRVQKAAARCATAPGNPDVKISVPERCTPKMKFSATLKDRVSKLPVDALSDVEDKPDNGEDDT